MFFSTKTGMKHLMLLALSFAGFMLLPVLIKTSAYADSAGSILTGESQGASIVFNTIAFNDASTDNLGIEIHEEEEVDSVDLVMANVRSVLNVRAEADIEGKIVGKIYKDCGGTVLEKGEEWSLIESGDLIGYASNEYLLFGEDAVQMAKNVGTTTAVISVGCVNVHSEANAESEVIGYASLNTLLEVIYEVDDEWICVAYGDYDGFIESSNVTLKFNIDHGETLEAIKERKRLENQAKNKLKRQNAAIAADDDTLRLLAALIYCEARGESYEGMLAVGSVVMNRVRSKGYPDSVYDVIFASGQFTPAMTGSLQRAYANGANAITYQAAAEVLNGFSNVGEMTHFRRKGSKEGYIIGNHVFY